MTEARTQAEAIHRETLADQVANLLMRSIVEEGMQPGDPLPGEMQLSLRYKVCRPVAREALRHLAALNMIKLSNGKVPVVKPVTGELLRTHFDWILQREEITFVELHELRRGVEGICAYYAAKRRDERDVQVLSSLLESMEREDVRNRFSELDVELHVAIARAAHNRLLQQTVESIRGTMGDVIRTGMSNMEHERRSESALVRLRRGHRKIIQPIVDKEPEVARERMDEHLRQAVARYVAAGRVAASRWASI
ncbi:MAG: FadR/GntR family transcriptional regulator [Candidatus Dormibacteraceae bacterium]